MKEGRIRFNSVFVSDQTPSGSEVEELKFWSREFQKNGLTPEVDGNYTGNLSFRSKEGFVITASGLKSKGNLTDDCFVYVKAYDEKSNTFVVEGMRQPSSETLMHMLIYKSNRGVNAVFHGHCDAIVCNAEGLGLPVTGREYASGTVELAHEVLKVVGGGMLVVLRNHGFVALGETMRGAGELALKALNRVKT